MFEINCSASLQDFVKLMIAQSGEKLVEFQIQNYITSFHVK